MRNPRRTARTASALMVGLALVSAISVFGASLSLSATSSVDDAIRADLILTPTGSIGGLSTLVPSTVAKLPGVTAETTVYQGQFEAMSSLVTLTAAATAGRRDDAEPDRGQLGCARRRRAAHRHDDRRQRHLSVGDRVPVKFAKTGPTVLYVGGLFEPNSLSRSQWQRA
jgi:putative ABC transport system permease protein